MADSFEKLEDILISAGKEVAKTTKELAGNAKDKIDIKSKEYDLKQLYAELGRTYYNDHLADETCDYDDLMQKIMNLDVEINQLKDKK